jgi:hypothetical protein
MLNPYIKRYCQLVVEINERYEFLDYERDIFYDGGHSFEEVYSSSIEELHKLEGEFIDILKMLKND